MNEDEVYETLPDDPGLAFVKLEKLYRHKFDEATRDLQESSVYEFHEMTYLNEVIAAAKSLDIPGIQDYELPQSNKQLYDFARMVRRDVESLVVQIRISNSQSVNRYSVALSATEKAKARHYIDQLDLLVDASECSVEKKEKLKKRLNDLRGEFEQDRTKFDRVTDRIRSIARLSGEFEREGAEPWWKWIKALLITIDDAKESEPRQSLPPNVGQRKIEAPRKQLPKPDFTRDLDDEVPF
ncbi:MAG: hypothetical protein ABIN69_06985 [Aestuariivirga sp.]